MSWVDSSFGKAARLIFGEELGEAGGYEKWLMEYLSPPKFVETAMDGKRLFIVPGFFYIGYVPEERIISESEVGKSQEKKVDASRILGLDGVKAVLGEIGYYNIEKMWGKYANVTESIFYGDSVGVHHCADVHDSKEIAYSQFITLKSECVFGSYRMFSSKFCIRCYNSRGLSVCFECDSCKGCGGLMFCHNCENVHDSLFCFNVKNLRYAVFNREVGRDRYLKLRGKLCKEIVGELKKRKEFGKSIYNL
jgi:hypothetical protein